MVNKGTGLGSGRLGSRTGALNQPRGSHVPSQGVSFIICKMMKLVELPEAPSSNNILGSRQGKEEAEWGKERGQKSSFSCSKEVQTHLGLALPQCSHLICNCGRSILSLPHTHTHTPAALPPPPATSHPRPACSEAGRGIGGGVGSRMGGGLRQKLAAFHSCALLSSEIAKVFMPRPHPKSLRQWRD